MHLSDKLTIDATRRTTDGYLAVNARVARAGNVQTYLGSEVGRPDLSTVRVYRPEDEVFSKDTLKSFAHKPVTLGHPSQPVSAGNWTGVAKGWSDGEVVRDGEFIRVSMMLADMDTIAAVEAGTNQLSMGYSCSLDWTGGTTPSGEPYEAVQRGIRGNHIACVRAARGGPDLRIGDSATPKELHKMDDAEIRDMYARVKTMTVDEAAKLPIFDNVRGAMVSGMPGERYWAGVAGAKNTTAVTDADHRSDALRDHLADQQRNAWKTGTVHDGRTEAPQFTRDGRPMSQLSDRDRAYEEMILDQANAWKV